MKNNHSYQTPRGASEPLMLDAMQLKQYSNYSLQILVVM